MKDSNQRTGKWHVSDLIFPRSAVLGRLHGRKPSRDEVGFFFNGEALHRMIQHILGKDKAEVRAEKHNIVGTCDWLDGDVLIEFKTSRKWTIPENPEEHYIKQASYYAVMFNVKKVRVAVVYPTSGRKWDGAGASTVEFMTWTIEFSDEDIKHIEEEMIEVEYMLKKAFKEKDVFSLPRCPEWKYGTVDYNKDKREYSVLIRCPFAKNSQCDCGESLRREADAKNANRRIIKDDQGKDIYSKRRSANG